MVNANRKGREAENRLSTWYTVHGYPNELIRLAGINERGDIWLPYQHHRIELKNHKLVLSAINEALHEVDKLVTRCPGDECFAVVARPGFAPPDWYVVKRVRDVWPPNVS